MLPFQERTYTDIASAKEVILVGDIGGTNSNFGIFTQQARRPVLLMSLQFKSQHVTNFASLVADVVTYVKNTYQLVVQRCCIAAAGVVDEARTYCALTNAQFAISTDEITRATGIESIILVNDFEIIGYGIDYIDSKDLIPVQKGVTRQHANKIILGAGTGLGKSLLYWCVERAQYVSLASEGGHADFAAHTQQEYDLIEFIRQEKQTSSVSWEDILSGDGIKRLYHFFHRKCDNESGCVISHTDWSVQPDKIFASRDSDQYCRQVVELYTQVYARCAKNYALDALALSGVYIAGGIATHNMELFKQKMFLDEFVNCAKYQDILVSVPITIIRDYNVSLYGAAAYLVHVFLQRASIKN